MATATKFRSGLFGRRLFGYSLGAGVHYPITHGVYFITTSITLKWHNPLIANLFQVQVNLRPDFSGSDIRNDATLTANNTTFTDSGTNDARRYWRWRWSANSGTTWSAWSRVGSYWLNTSGAQAISVARNTWMMINPSPVTDRYAFETFPTYQVVPEHIRRAWGRNRLGTLLSEYVTIKARLSLEFDERCWLYTDEFSEARRFNEEVKTFFVAMNHDFQSGEPVPNIWKVQYESDPMFSMLASGRQGLMVGTLTFKEV